MHAAMRSLYADVCDKLHGQVLHPVFVACLPTCTPSHHEGVIAADSEEEEEQATPPLLGPVVEEVVAHHLVKEVYPFMCFW